MTRFADVDDVLDDHKLLIMACDQDGFINKGIVFCKVVPLMTADGERFEDLSESFPNSGRVWWYVGLEETTTRVPRFGELLTAAIELAPNWDPSRTDKEKFQVHRPTVSLGIKRWTTIIEIDGHVTKIQDLLSDRGVRPIGPPPVGKTFVLTAHDVYGPFSVRQSPQDDRVVLSAGNSLNPVIRRIPRQEFESKCRFETVSFDAYPGSQRIGSTTHVTMRFIADKDMATVEKLGTAIDAMSDAQIVKWALGQADYSNANQRLFKDALQKVSAATASATAETKQRLDRFRAICADAELISRMGAEIAESISASMPFRDIVQRHIDATTKKKVDELVLTRSVEVNLAVQSLQVKLQELAGQYDQKKQEQEQALKREYEAFISSLDQREATILKEENALRTRQNDIAQRLEHLLKRLGDESSRVADDVLIQLPILSRLGIGPSAPSGNPEAENATKDIVAPFVSRPLPQEHMTESAFVDQFCGVAAQRGFSFSRDDLLNFHIAVKTGFWTVLVGPSGIGKSTLPRLYSEALGMKDEYLKIEVRPDWLDDRDVIGAYNPLSRKFEPATAGLVDHLIAAREDSMRSRGGIYVVCFDEMNLARVEHYLAQFLSIMEDPAGSRSLKLFSRGLERTGDPYARYRELPIDENVRFVGTVNIDATTHFFSPKVLDRAAVLTLDPIDHAVTDIASLKAKDLPVRVVNCADYRSWIRPANEVPDGVRDSLLRLDRILQEIHCHIGHRLRDRIFRFVASAKNLLTTDRALDLAITQSVLPRLATHHARFAAVVDRMLQDLPAVRFPRTGKMLAAMKDAGGEYGFFQLL